MRHIKEKVMIRTKKPNLAAAALLALSAVFLAGCAPSGPSAAVPETSYREDDTLAAFNGLWYDYDPMHSPDELAKLSEVVISGNVEGVRVGRTTTYPKNDRIKGSTTIVLAVTNLEAVRGKLPTGNEGSIYIELANPGQKDPAEYGKAFPAGSSVVAYLVQAGDGRPREGVDVAIESPEAGRPAGQSLFLPANPQGISLQVDEREVVWPLIQAQKPGQIVDALPGGNLIAE